MKHTPVVSRFLGKVLKRADGIWEWRGHRDKDGYGQFWLNGKTRHAHRVAWEMFVGEIPQNMCVCHKNDVSYDVNPDNMFLDSAAGNNRDRAVKGRSAPQKGASNNATTLTEAHVRDIREMWALPKELRPSQIDMAKFYNVHQGTISSIVRRINWTHI
jgi:hypothetical protein